MRNEAENSQVELISQKLCYRATRLSSNHYRLFILLLACWQKAAPVVPSRAGWVALPARHARVAAFGVRQPRCRRSRAHDPVRGTPLTLLVTGRLDVLVTFIELVRSECANFYQMFFEIGSGLWVCRTYLVNLCHGNTSLCHINVYHS